MWLLFLTPVNTPIAHAFGDVPARSLLHGVLFVGCSHLWLSAFNRQLKYPALKKNAFVIVPLIAVVTIIPAELIGWYLVESTSLTTWNLIFDMAGASLGILSFRLLYNNCY
jgi:hypothetical protein